LISAENVTISDNFPISAENVAISDNFPISAECLPNSENFPISAEFLRFPTIFCDFRQLSIFEKKFFVRRLEDEKLTFEKFSLCFKNNPHPAKIF
jgi:hypothetical protein